MKKIIIPITVVLLAVTACEKKTSPVDESNATITLRNSGTNFVTDNITVNPKDSIFFDYTVTSSTDMRFVSIQKNPANQTAFVVRDTMTAATKNSYSVVKRLRADSINGSYIYHFVAHTANGVYIGHKAITVTVKADYTFWSYRFLKVPDSAAKINKCYFATSNGNSYSYSDGASISNLIDFGYFYDTTMVTVNSTLQPKGHTIYTLPNTITPFAHYDISTWTKNATLLKSTSTTVASITSAGAIRTACVPALNSGTVTRFSQTDRGTQANINLLLTGQNFVFKTVTGKYGVMGVSFTNNEGSNSSINIDVKIEK
ncbi:hypothetical protein [Ferruginibacter sp.]